MKKMFFVIVMIVLATPPAAMADDTARSGLAQAMKVGKTWQPDAGLTRIGATKADSQGKALVWEYQFYSPNRKQCYRVVLLKGNVFNTTDLGKCTSGKPVSTEFVDSPVAMEQAKKNGFKTDEENTMYLSRSKDRLAKGKECWTLHTRADFDSTKAVMRGWCVDAKTGKFFIRLSGSN